MATRKLLLIIAEAALEKNLIADAKRFGAHGYTVSDVRGASQEGERDGEWEFSRSIEMKVICSETVAQTLAQHLLSSYCQHYSITMFIAEGEVLRPERF